MSVLIGQAASGTGQATWLNPRRKNQNADDIQAPDYRISPPQHFDGYNDQWRLTDVLWTRSSFPSQLNAGAGGNGSSGLDSVHQLWEWNFPRTGVHVRKKISGLVLDATGAPVSGAVVNLFNTATDLAVDVQTSGTDGSYEVSDPNAVTCYAVADKAGGTETAGTTVQNLSGA